MDEHVETMTICVQCKHHVCLHDGSEVGPPRDIWYYQVCAHPDTERMRGVDPVSGKTCFWTKNDLGGSYPTDEGRPTCRDTNKDGDCSYYEPR